MRLLLIIGAALLLGGVVAACVFWAGVDQAAGLAFALGGLGLSSAIAGWIGQLGNWNVPGDEPHLWRRGS